MDQVRLAFVVHNHQPVGNFPEVFEAAYRDGYLPFLELLEANEHFAVTMHISGPLLEWLEVNRPEYIERLGALVDRGQVEILGGAFYEPILSMIPPRDRYDQIVLFRDHLERLFRTRVRGIWLAERVWEPEFARELANAGVEYTLLDDFHFKVAGLQESELTGYYLTEDAGTLLKVFPISEPLRYFIPFRPPEETIAYCRRMAQGRTGVALVFGDDGEKFGVWPETRKHVYEDRWLPRFLEALAQERAWLTSTTLGEIVNHLPPLGTVYLPDCAYREMTEWALPTECAEELRALEAHFQHDPAWPQLRRFIRGGSWRNFRVKYPEAMEMYCRMLEVSRKVHAIDSLAANHEVTLQHTYTASVADAARRELHRAQCNCAYWHGWFGGVYLPHLRHAVYRHLLRAEELAQTVSQALVTQTAATVEDFNLDARKEVKLENGHLSLYIAPARGGCVYELDVRPAYFNLLAVVSRHREPYHHRLVDKIAASPEASRLLWFAAPDAQPQLIHDSWRRAFGVDHVYCQRPTLQSLLANRGEELLDCPLAVYPQATIQRGEAVECVLERIARIGGARVALTKRYRLDPTEAELQLTYELQLLEALPQPCSLAPELTLAAMAGHTPDRYLRLANGSQTPCLGIPLEAERTDGVAVCDEYMGLTVQLQFSREAGLISVPLETVSQSEAGFDRVFQGVILTPFWPLPTAAGERFAVSIAVRLDVAARPATSAEEPAVVRSPIARPVG